MFKIAEVLSIDGTNIYYEVIGEGDISLVFIGGLGIRTGRVTWRNQLSLAKKFKLILIDLPGHGKSGINRENYTMELYGYDVKVVIEELDLKRIILIGWSMGGAVILEATNLIKNRIIGLIPVDSLFPSSYIGLDEETIQKRLKPFEKNFVEAYTNSLLSSIPDKSKPEFAKRLRETAETLDKRSYLSARREISLWNMHDILPKIKKPIKCILGSKSMEQGSKDEYGNYFDFVIAEGLGYLLPIEDPIIFNTIFEQTILELIQK